MTEQDFLSRLAEVLDHDGVIAADQALGLIPEWDSLGILSVIELLSELGVKVKPDSLKAMVSVSELLAVAEAVVNG